VLQIAGLDRLPVVGLGTPCGVVEQFGDLFVEGVVEICRDVVVRECVLSRLL